MNSAIFTAADKSGAFISEEEYSEAKRAIEEG